jgi:hypothetical protein
MGEVLARKICEFLNGSAAFHWSVHLAFTQEAKVVLAGVVGNSSWACVAKGRWDLRCHFQLPQC